MSALKILTVIAWTSIFVLVWLAVLNVISVQAAIGAGMFFAIFGGFGAMVLGDREE